MPTPIEQQIAERIQARMKRIKTANGYNLNFDDARVAIWETNWQESEGIAISIFTGETSSIESPEGHRNTLHELAVTIDGFLFSKADSTITPVTAWNFIADVKKAIKGTAGESNKANQYLSERWPAVEGTGPGLAWTTAEKGHVIMRQENSFEIVGARVMISIVYQTEKFNSYA
jgi:hypothetical protein